MWKSQRDAFQAYGDGKKPLYIDVTDYEIYTHPEANFLGELHSLDYMDVAGKKLHLNGVLSIGSVRHYVQGIPVKSYSIEGYGQEITDPTTTIYIISPEASSDPEYDLWYKLVAPSRQYQRFHNAFQWVANLGKHVIDFLEVQHSVSLGDFRQRFSDWLHERFLNNPDVNTWREAYGSTDFRKIVHAYISYLWSEALCLQDNSLHDHPLWKQCSRTDDDMIKPKCGKTVATPHVYNCFKKRYFAEQIKEVQLSSKVSAARESRIRALRLPSISATSFPARKISSRPQKQFEIGIGDVVSLAPDEFESHMWRKKATDATAIYDWLGYVQRVASLADGRQRLYVIWLYRPEDTTISTTDYPVPKELFISDNCNCDEHPLLSSEVHRICSVDFYSNGYDTHKDFLVRQKYDTTTSSFITLKETDFQCTCQGKQQKVLPAQYTRGDTVYLSEKGFLEPVVVKEVDAATNQATIRRLLRLRSIHRDASSVAANELVWTDCLESVPMTRLEGRCYVRFFPRSPATHIPFPYNQGGTGHCWIISLRLDRDSKLEDLPTQMRPEMREGPDYSTLAKKLPGLSLFSGLGNLDKGLEAGGAVHFHTAIDMNGRAIQTIRANAEEPEKLKLWFGSVDDYLHALLSDSDEPTNATLIAKIGDVAVIAGGSPCPGFSKLQQNWLSDQSLRNAAHVTTFASFVDVYRPEYGFLENVVNMGITRKGFEGELVLSQLIGCLVSMGYQVQQFIMGSWNYGSSQHRNRLILSIAAPGRTPLTPPRPTHDNYEGFTVKSVGRLLNGERFGVQQAKLTPFPHVTAGEAIGHLPDLGCGVRHPCIRSPDHVLRCRPNIRETRCIAHVPTDPPGVGLEYAIKCGSRIVPEYLYETRSEISSKSYRRIKKNGLIGTIVTAPSPHDSRAGPFVHWKQNRCITLEEARLAQGIPPDEVLIGNVSDQYKMVGNAVDRRVSEALGLELRRAMDQDASKSAKKPSVSVVVDVRKRSRVKITTENQEGQLANDSNARKENEVQPANVTKSTSTTWIESRRSLLLVQESTNSQTKSSFSMIPEHGDDEDFGPVARGHREFAQSRLSHVATSRKSTHNTELEERLIKEFGFDLSVKPGQTVTGDDKMVDFDDLSVIPPLAMSRKGLPGHLSKFGPASPVQRSSPTTEPSFSASAPDKSQDLTTSGLYSCEKRSRDETGAINKRSASSSSEEMEILNKRIRATGPGRPTGNSVSKESARAESATKLGQEGDTNRLTRHSGLEVRFGPQTWNTVVEKEVKAKTKAVDKPPSRRYA